MLVRIEPLAIFLTKGKKMKEPKLYELPPKDCWAFINDQWVKAELDVIELNRTLQYYVLLDGKSIGVWVEQITFENPTETRLPTKAELCDLLRNHPQLRVRHNDKLDLWSLEGDVLLKLNEFEFTLDLGDTFYSFERDWSEEL